MIDPDVGMQFLSFVEARHQAWLNRQVGAPAPWTDDPIVNTRKFTNVFRVLDYGSQFVMKELLDPSLSPRDQLARLFLYRHTGRVEVWEYMKVMSGEYPTSETLDDALEMMKEYRGETKVHLKSPRKPGQTGRGNGKQKMIGQRSVFTAAYLVFPQSQEAGSDKLESIVDLTRRLFTPGADQDLWPWWSTAENQLERFQTLRRNKGVADFMSMQILTDWGYSEQCGEDLENEFVVAGPGAKKGAAHLDPTAKAEDVIQWAREAILSSPSCPRIEVHDDVFRFPSYMDAQNTLCEFSKYVRYASRPEPAKPYVPAHPGPQPAPLLPKHW